MKATEIIKAEELSVELVSRGICGNFLVSTTDYGVSCYFTFYKDSESSDKYVIRISDHSATNGVRMASERMEFANSINIIKVANAIELYLFPERFEFVKSATPTHRANGVFGEYKRLN